MQAVILAGGKGTRLGNLVEKTPKPMLDIAGTPFLDYLIWNLQRYGIDDIIISTGYQGQEIEKHFSGAENIIICHEDTPLGTGGALKHAAHLLQDDFFVLNGDTLFDINFLDLLKIYKDNNAKAAIALRGIEDVSRYGCIDLTGNQITGFHEKTLSGPGVINGGVFILSKALLELLPSGFSQIEQSLFEQLIADQVFYGQVYDGFFIDIGIPETFNAAQTSIPDWKRKPALFLDRDGTININHGYVHKKQDFEWNPGAIETIKWANDKGIYVFIVTNQAGIGRGYYTEETFLDFSNWINSQLLLHGAHIDQTFHCPHHPTHGVGQYLKDCSCRKPNPGLLLRAMDQWDIAIADSLLIGDNQSDLLAAEACGVASTLYSDGSLFACLQETRLWQKYK